MALWGAIVVSSTDNFIRAWLISRTASLSFLPVFLGVVGGALAFGFLGIFLGPVLLALGVAVIKSWAEPQPEPLARTLAPRAIEPEPAYRTPTAL